jgi:hypothetical protein
MLSAAGRLRIAQVLDEFLRRKLATFEELGLSER